jgi:hypothetical protein
MKRETSPYVRNCKKGCILNRKNVWLIYDAGKIKSILLNCMSSVLIHYSCSAAIFLLLLNWWNMNAVEVNSEWVLLWICVTPIFLKGPCFHSSFSSRAMCLFQNEHNKWKKINCCYFSDHRSEWPRGLRHELSSPARMLGSCVRIPLKAWIFVCLFCVCISSGFATGWSPIQGVLPTG